MASLVVLVPVYRPELPPIEAWSLRESLRRLQPGRDVRFIAPASLDTGGLTRLFPHVAVDRHDDACFASIPGYNRTLLSEAFHDRYADRTFMLVLQTDALLLRDELDTWCSLPYDYVGAPWPQPVQVKLQLDGFADGRDKVARAHVGNGGLSLRRVQACRALLQEFPQAVEYFRRSGSSEDLYFGLLGSVSQRFVLPNEMVAARFALELEPSAYHAQLGGRAPMGGHAWWKYEPGYWLDQLGPAAVAEARALLAPTPAAVPADAVACA